MPGNKSLEAHEYYAHRQNAFWRIVDELLGVDRLAPYRKRMQALKEARIAVWDVLRSCTRTGSMDSAIDKDSEIANDFVAFFRSHREITHVFFNGSKAAASFKRHVLPGLGTRLRYIRLPSTSPAHASVAYERKREAWQRILKPAKRNRP
jgi:hypoxanthine-DNA glycosylase